ncbi:MAG: 50S ribosomal protein L19 [Saprospiraceae bacterium]
MMDAIKFVQEQLMPKKDYPKFRAGDNIQVSYKIVEGNKERIQAFRGDVIQIKGTGATKTFTVRKISNGVGVERIFPFTSPSIVEIKLVKRGKVRRSRLFYLRDLVGKKARIKERKFISSHAANAGAED